MGWDADVESPVKTRRHIARSILDIAYANNGMALVAQGLAGMGKTHFLRELMTLAQEDNRWSVIYVTADIFERDEPYGFLERLLSGPSMQIPGRERLDGSQMQPITVARELLRHADIASAVQQVIIVDDAQWIDTESALVLRYLVPRLTQRSILAAFGIRTPHAPGGFGEHLQQLVDDNPGNRLVSFDPLSAEEIRMLAHSRLGRSISPRNAERLRNATGGSFLHIASIFDHLTEEEVAKLHLTWDIPLRMIHPAKNPLLIGYEGLSTEARATTEIVCFSGEISSVDLSKAAAELDEPVELQEALQAGVLRETGFGSKIAPSHALIAHAVQEAVPGERSRVIARALAAPTSGFRSIYFALNAADHLDAALLEQVRAYVEGAIEGSAFANVNTVLETALELVRPNEPEIREELLITLALANLRNKSLFLLLPRYDEYRELSPSFIAELLGVALDAYHPEHPFPQERAAALLQRQPESADDRTVQAYLALLMVIMNMRTSDYSNVPELLDHAIMLQQLVPNTAELEDARLAWMADREGHLALLHGFETVILHRGYDVDGTQAAIAHLQADIATLPDGANKVDAQTILAGAASQIGEITLANTLAHEINDLLDRAHKPWMLGTALLILADTQVLLGRYQRAREFITAIEELSYDALDLETRPMFTALQAIIASITDDPKAQQLMRDSKVLYEFEWEGYAPDLALLAECEYARASGDAAAVLRAANHPRAEAYVNTKRGHLTYKAHALLDTGQLQEAAELVHWLGEQRGVQWHECWGTLAWLEARLAMLNGKSKQANAKFADALQLKEYPLPLALTHLDYATFLTAEHRIPEARTQLMHAEKLLRELGAKAYLPRLQDAFAALDTAGQAAQGAVLAGLTDREREIARLLASGKSNQQIADALVVSLATVRFHVSNVLRKLQLSSRTQVAALLND